MKKFTIITIISLCSAFCGAQTLFSKTTSTPLSTSYTQGEIRLNRNSKDSQRRALDIERMFKKRANERILQLCDIFSCLSSTETDKDQKIYCLHMVSNLFADSTYVKLKEDSTTHELKNKDFWDFLVSNSDKFHMHLDSLEVPVWNKKMLDFDSLNVIYVESEIRCIHSEIVSASFSKDLPVICNETEDGDEWIPLFGNMIVTIYKRDEKTEINLQNMDIINNLLRTSPDDWAPIR